MEEEKERGRGVMENLSFPRDLLQRFMCSSSTSSRSSNVVQDVRSAAFRGDEEEEEDPEELELSLGLSLGGRFGIDRSSKKNNLGRSSSIIGTVPFVRDISFGGGGGGGGEDSSSPAPAVSYPMLMRTSSLPVETEEEWRKRKEIQTMRRMAAKRRRSAKQRNSTGGGGKATEREEEGSVVVGPSPSVSRQNTIGGGGVDLAAVVAVAVAARNRQMNSQASAESPVGSSSGISELESRVGQGSISYGESRSPTGHPMSIERSLDTTGPAGPSGIKMTESKCSTSGIKLEPNPGGNKGGEIGTNAVEDMPCVFTKGDGPNGRRVDGILYRYGKGEEVRIMCVCHGKFLSPAEFVKHAGGGDVDNPLRHIVINPSASSFL